MKLASYTGQQLLTTDDVADALVELAAAIARDGATEALQIPLYPRPEADDEGFDGPLDSGFDPEL